jgi:hypothetical protein
VSASIYHRQNDFFYHLINTTHTLAVSSKLLFRLSTQVFKKILKLNKKFKKSENGRTDMKIKMSKGKG